MRKARTQEILRGAGLPTPIFWCVQDKYLLTNPKDPEFLRVCEEIVNEGSGRLGVRTEPIDGGSPTGSYPCSRLGYTPESVLDYVRDLPKEPSGWWIMVTEAFNDNQWNAVVRVSTELYEPGQPRLEGEINLIDQVMLRPAMANVHNLVNVLRWRHPIAAKLRKMILRSGILEDYLEISCCPTPKHPNRLVFWGVRESPNLVKANWKSREEGRRFRRHLERDL